MASKSILVIVAISVIILPVAMAAEYVVGDDKGWVPGVNYTEWAAGKEFYIGDTLVFKYTGNHTVYKVNGSEFKACTFPVEKPLTSGRDVITLGAEGKKWYLCGIKNHCSLGQKLVINVQSSLGPAPSPSPPSNSPTSDGALISAFSSMLLAAFFLVVARLEY